MFDWLVESNYYMGSKVTKEDVSSDMENISDSRKPTEVNVGLYGAGETGKSTFFNHLNDSNLENLKKSQAIYSNILSSVMIISDLFLKSGLKFQNSGSESLIKVIQDKNIMFESEFIFKEYSSGLLLLWSDETFQNFYKNNRNHLHIPDGTF